jgi:hypothetical protein
MKEFGMYLVFLAIIIAVLAAVVYGIEAGWFGG